MANAGIGIPFEYRIEAVGGQALPPSTPWANVANDEPGLVTGSDSYSTAHNSYMVISVSGAENVSFLCVLASENSEITARLDSFSSLADALANTSPTPVVPYTGPLSLNRSGSPKIFETFSPTSRKYFRVYFRNGGASSKDTFLWRVLVGKWVEPDDNIEVGPSVRVDDRQNRRYAFTGRRNFVDAGVYPAFSGKWPWIDRESFEQDFRPMMLKYGASRPMVFCLDREDTDWGEDGLYYGDLEKDLSITLDDAELHEFSFSIVDIAPVVSS